MKDTSVLNTAHRFIRPLNISGKTIHSSGADPARTTPRADRIGRALQAFVATGQGGVGMQFCAPAKNAGALGARPRWRTEDFNRQPALLPPPRPHRANRKSSWREAPQKEQGRETRIASTWQHPTLAPRGGKSDLSRHLRDTALGVCRKQQFGNEEAAT